jgi:two-component system NarL family response regulator
MVPARPNTILIVDDFAPFRRFIRSRLHENGFQNVSEASDGTEALAKAADLRPDVVLLDIGMPNLDGIKAVTQIRTLAPEAKIVFLSQYTDPDIMRAALSDGAVGYVCKSEMYRELLPAIEAALEGKTFAGMVLRRT